MKTAVYCRVTTRGVHSFYLRTGEGEYFLFSQSYRRGVDRFYRKGVFLDDAIRFSKAHNDPSIIRTMGKIPMYVKYLEKEYGLVILNKTKKKNSQSYNSARCA